MAGIAGTERGSELAATGGVVASLVVVLGAVLPWVGVPVRFAGLALGSPLAVAIGAVALLAFVLRRVDALSRPLGAGLAGLAGAAVVALAYARLIAPSLGDGAGGAVGLGIGVAGVGALLCIGLAAADYRAVTASRLREMARRVAVGTAVTVAAFVLLIVVSAFIGAALSGTESVRARIVAQTVAIVAEVAFVVVGVAFLVWTGRGLGYLDVGRPDRRDVGWMAAGLLGLLAIQIVFALVVSQFGVPTSPNSLSRLAERAAEAGAAGLILLNVPMMLFVVGPAEELLFRGVIQKYLYAPFGRRAAVLVASVVFAVSHVPAYYSTNPAEVAVSISVIFVLSLVLGVIFERTENLAVTAVVHGVFNAVLVVLTYVAITNRDAIEAAAVAL